MVPLLLIGNPDPSVTPNTPVPQSVETSGLPSTTQPNKATPAKSPEINTHVQKRKGHELETDSKPSNQLEVGYVPISDSSVDLFI